MGVALQVKLHTTSLIPWNRIIWRNNSQYFKLSLISAPFAFHSLFNGGSSSSFFLLTPHILLSHFSLSLCNSCDQTANSDLDSKALSLTLCGAHGKDQAVDTVPRVLYSHHLRAESSLPLLGTLDLLAIPAWACGHLGMWAPGHSTMAAGLCLPDHWIQNPSSAWTELRCKDLGTGNLTEKSSCDFQSTTWPRQQVYSLNTHAVSFCLHSSTLRSSATWEPCCS